MTISPEDLARWRALCEKVTAGPWEAWKKRDNIVGVSAPGPNCRIYCEPIAPFCLPETIERVYADSCFIAESRTAMPALITEVERLTKRLDELEIERNERDLREP